MNLKKSNIGIILGIIISISTIVTILFKVDGRYSKAYQLEKVEKKIEVNYQQSMAADQQILKTFELDRLQRRANNLEERMWKLLDTFGKEEDMPQEIRDEYRKLKSEREEILKRIGKLLEESNEDNT